MSILLWIIAHLVFLIFFSGVELGLLQVCLAFYEGKEPTVADALKNLELGPKFLAGQVFYLSLVAISLPLFRPATIPRGGFNDEVGWAGRPTSDG